MHQRISPRRTARFWRLLVAGLIVISLPGLTALPAQAEPGPIAGASVAATPETEDSENDGWTEDEAGQQAEEQADGQAGDSEDTAEAAEVNREPVEPNIDKVELDTLSAPQNAPLNEPTDDASDEATEEDGEDSSEENEGSEASSSEEDSDGEWKTYEGTESPDEEAEQSTEEGDGSGESEELTRENTGSLPESSNLPQDGDQVYWADSGERETDAFTLAALTWTGDHGSMKVWMSARSGDEWTEPIEMPVNEDQPDENSDEAQQARGGTEPMFTDSAEAVRVWVTTEEGDEPPEDLRIDLIDPGQASDADATAAQAAPAIAEAPANQASEDADAPEGSANVDTAAAAPRPGIHSREQWGADESIRDGSPSYGEVDGVIIHHTAGANGYSESQVPSIIRGIYAYHVLGRGWSDIGYNVLIDRFGGMWEGRAGGLDRAVSGAHAANYNHVAFGVSMMGTYSNVEPGDAAIESFEEVIAWKFGIHDVDPNDTVSYPGLSTENTIAGHRDVGFTECPGDRIYNKFDQIREGVTDKMEGSDVPDPEVELSGDSSVHQGEAATLNVSWTRGDENVTGVMNLERRTENGWATSKQIEVANGSGSATVRPSETTTYRLRASSASKPDDVDTSHPEGTSNNHEVTVTQEPEVTLSGDETVTEGEAATLNVGWKHGQTGVTGVMNVERRNADSSWTFVRQVEVTDGTGSTTVQPGTSTTYRLRASSASSPTGVDTSHPEGTSGWHRVTVESQPESELTMSGPGAVMQGEPAELSIGWSHDSSEVTGVVSLQRNEGDSWTELREVEVTDGQATTTITPGGNNTYRVQGVSISSPDISTKATSVTSDPIGVRGFAPPSLSLTGPTIVGGGDEPSLDIRWLSGTAGLSGTVDLERRSGGSWVHVREVDVSGGRASTDVPVEPNTMYRLRASSLRGPDGMSIDETGHASQIYTMAVRSN